MQKNNSKQADGNILFKLEINALKKSLQEYLGVPVEGRNAFVQRIRKELIEAEERRNERANLRKEGAKSRKSEDSSDLEPFFTESKAFKPNFKLEINALKKELQECLDKSKGKSSKVPCQVEELKKLTNNNTNKQLNHR